MANVYISSTYEDLKAYREAASRALQELRHNVRAMEAYVASDQRPVDKCLADVDWCNFYVGIFAWRCGFVPSANNPEQRSITELEYRRAVDQKKQCLLFLLHETAPWPPPLMDATTGAGERGARIVRLRHELASIHTCSFFTTTDELARLVTAAITNALEARTAADIDAERREREVESERQGRREGQRVVGLRVFDAGTLFRDRVEYRQELGRLLAEPATRIVSVVGRPGIGKTALAAKVLAELEQGRWPHTEQGRPVDGIAYLNASRERLTLETLYHDCALMLGGVRESALRAAWRDTHLTIEDKVERLLHALESGLYVVLLDHLDSLLDDEACLIDPDLRVFVERALLAPRRTRLLLTSRAPLTLSPQARPFHRHVMLDNGLPTLDGIGFLRDLDPDGVLRLRDLPDEPLGRAVQRLHGIPRALELLVALVQRDVFRSLDEILEDFYRSPDVMNELVRAAFQRLDAEERLVVNILAVLERPVKKHVVEFMVRPFTPGLAVDRVLSDLVQSRMVRIDRDAGLLSLNAIDHDYALSELPPDGEGGPTIARASSGCLLCNARGRPVTAAIATGRRAPAPPGGSLGACG
jgi:hypothetical protein